MRPIQATVSLSALRHNLGIAKSAALNSKIMAVVKANGYGHGLLNVAAGLNHAEGFAVLGLDEAIGRINAAASVGADLGLMFPRSQEDAVEAPRRSKLPLVYVQSRGNRDGRPIYSNSELKGMGYCANIDAQILIGVGVHFWQQALREIVETGNYTGISESSFLTLRKNIEDLIGLEEHYNIEQRTVQKDGRPA